ncbi:MAG TPA: enoyl-CoA hydratase-related protein [Myxococcota bacterium]|nr:enoyl-CoA hydratase-related protein [Myxococcota bacterium]
MDPRNVRVRTRDAFAHVTLARPERRNTLSLETIDELDAAFAEIGAGKSRGVLLDAEGPVFSAGHDFADMAGRDLAGTRALLARCAEMMQRIQRIPQPVLASVAGLATAAGCQLVATCDLAVASSEARFATPGGRGGWFCHTPMVAVSRAVGRKRALELLLTGDAVDAATAADWGLVNRVVPPGDLDAASWELLERATRGSAFSKGLGKQSYYAQIDLDQPKAYDYATEVMSSASQHPDAQEGMRAFLEKRRPVFED